MKVFDFTATPITGKRKRKRRRGPREASRSPGFTTLSLPNFRGSPGRFSRADVIVVVVVASSSSLRRRCGLRRRRRRRRRRLDEVTNC